jgi:hypothetical protein
MGSQALYGNRAGGEAGGDGAGQARNRRAARGIKLRGKPTFSVAPGACAARR